MKTCNPHFLSHCLGHRVLSFSFLIMVVETMFLQVCIFPRFGCLSCSIVVVLAFDSLFSLSKLSVLECLALGTFNSLYGWHRFRGGLPFVFIRKSFVEVLLLVDIEKRVESILVWLGCQHVSLPGGKLRTGVTAPLTSLHNHLPRLGSYRH